MLVRVTLELEMPETTIAQNVMVFDVNAGPSNTDAEVRTTLQNHIAQALGHWNDSMSNVAAFRRLIFHEVTPGTPPTFRPMGENAINVAGEVAARMLPHGVALMVRIPTEVTRREGRMYLAAFETGSVNVNGIWEVVPIASATSGALDIITDFTDGGTGLTSSYRVMSPTTGAASPSTGSVITDTIPDYQRRRKPGVGI